MEKTKLSSKRIHAPQARDNSATNGTISRTPECLRPIRGAHSSFIHASEWAGRTQLCNFSNYVFKKTIQYKYCNSILIIITFY